VWRAPPMNGITEEETRVSIGQYALEALYGLMLLTIPKVANVKQAEFSRKHAKKRKEQGKAPLLSFHKVTVHIGQTTRYESGAGHNTGGGGKKRYHRVEPFFRTYTKGRDLPKIAYVPRHYRGDPELGISITERHVK
jgi:hypothetical protein